MEGEPSAKLKETVTFPDEQTLLAHFISKSQPPVRAQVAVMDCFIGAGELSLRVTT